jgi:NADH dehydrogenase
MPKRIFVSGASGFVGSAVVDELLARDYGVSALTNKRPVHQRPGLRSFSGGLFDAAAVDAAMDGCDAAIHLVGIIFENPATGSTFDRIHTQGTRAVVEAAARKGVKRFLHMSALGTRPTAVSNYHKTKYAAERIVETSGLDWTIFRPALIHGPGGEFMDMEAHWARHSAPPFLFMPYFGAGLSGCGGAGKLQPVFVGDVARAFVDAVDKPQTIGEVYPLVGPDRFTWPEFHRACAKEITGKQPLVMPMPVWVGLTLAAVLPSSLLGFNRDQILMSQEDNIADPGKAAGEFGWEPRAMIPLLHEYAGKL